jgi:hypothetical protein
MGCVLMENWYTWSTEQAFDVWHQTVITDMNLPRIGFNQATGEPQPEKAQTTAYTEVVLVAQGDYRAIVEDAVATQFADHLGTLSEAPPLPELDL